MLKSGLFKMNKAPVIDGLIGEFKFFHKNLPKKTN